MEGKIKLIYRRKAISKEGMNTLAVIQKSNLASSQIKIKKIMKEME